MLKTEMRNPNTTHFDKMELSDMLKIMNEENRNAVNAVGDCIDDIAEAVKAVNRGFAAGGRLFYVGAGTSGRLGIIDAAECPPTFGVDYDKVIGIIAGGRDAMFRANEGGEDSAEVAVADISRYSLTANDVVIGISAAGGAAYVASALEYAKRAGCVTVALTSNAGTRITEIADISIVTDTGAEVVTGSTRLKAGTAQKLVLNMISTCAMVRSGYVYENLMINLRPTNIKLRGRMIRIVSDIMKISEAEAERRLDLSDWNIKAAVEGNTVARVEDVDGLPTITVNGKPLAEMAYITYRTNHNRYADFAEAGVGLYSVNLNFSEMPINEKAPVLVFQKGIFEGETPDFRIVDRNFDQILEACPNAYIFPRVNMNLPEWWEQAHPDELCDKGFGERKRFSYASDLWAEAVAERLAALVEYIENSPYKNRVIGYQLAAGNTEEWLPIDPDAGRSLRAREKYEVYCAEKGAPACEETYCRFMSELIADRIMTLGALVKKMTGRRKLVGAFFGYILGVGRVSCHQALGRVLACDDVDFLCSPINYKNLRAPGYDLYPMIPTASLRHHGKLFFSENDLRTHLSRPVHDHPNYTLPVWYGPEKPFSIAQIKLGFCRAMLYGYGMWWFDMWGGWYADPDYMALMGKMMTLCREGMDIPDTEVAVFLDEDDHLRSGKFTGTTTRAIGELGLCGAPYDVYLMTDFDETFEKYRVCIFLEPTEVGRSQACVERAEAAGKAVLRITPESEPSAAELHDWLTTCGAEVPASRCAIVYRGKKYISLYAPEEGEYDFCDKGKRSFRDAFTGDTVTFPRTLAKADCFLLERG